jgi:hypothetical protein
VAFGDFVLSRGDPEAFWTGGFFAWFMAAGLLGMMWYLWVAIQVARKRDPIYDRIAGTAVLRG